MCEFCIVKPDLICYNGFVKKIQPVIAYFAKPERRYCMKILVCVKQVPGSSNVEVDPVTGVLKRDGVASKMNPYDLYGIELALDLVEAHGGTVLSDRKFAGADVLATAYTLSQGVRAAGDFDLIICGKQTTDGDTAQVGAELAEYLGVPHAANVLSVDSVEDGVVFVTVSLDDKIVKESIKLPCLLCADGDINSPRLPSYKVKKTVGDELVRFLSFADFADQNEKHYGLAGSATQVERIFPPEKNTEKRSITGSAAEQAEGIFDLLVDRKLI